MYVKSFSRTPFFAKGFTLIELMVVIAIIGILATIVTTSLGTGQAKARDARRIADANNIKLSLELYYNDNLKYPPTLASLVPNYTSTLPVDPKTNASYSYAALVSGSSANCTLNSSNKFHLGANLEVLTNSALGQDYDAPAASYAAASPWNGFSQCSNSNPDFNGQAATCGGSSLSLTPNATTATGLDGCYDISS